MPYTIKPDGSVVPDKNGNWYTRSHVSNIESTNQTLSRRVRALEHDNAGFEVVLAAYKKTLEELKNAQIALIKELGEQQGRTPEQASDRVLAFEKRLDDVAEAAVHEEIARRSVHNHDQAIADRHEGATAAPSTPAVDDSA